MFDIKFQDQSIHSGGQNGKLTFATGLSKKKQGQFSQAQKYVDSEVIRRCDPLTPFKEGALKDSASIHTKIGSGKITYGVEYDKKQYYNGQTAGKGQRGRLWFERMKASNKADILKGAKERFK